MSVLAWFLLTAIGALVAAEVIEWCGPAQRALLRLAAAKLPEGHRERYLEEWTAELEALPGGPLNRFRYTIWLVIGGASRLASELPPQVHGRASGSYKFTGAAEASKHQWAHLNPPKVSVLPGELWSHVKSFRADGDTVWVDAGPDYLVWNVWKRPPNTAAEDG